jgi:hypothetical protein
VTGLFSAQIWRFKNCVKLKDEVDGGAFGPESELLRWEEVVNLEEIF